MSSLCTGESSNSATTRSGQRHQHLSPYLTQHLLRFGKFATRCEAEPSHYLPLGDLMLKTLFTKVPSVTSRIKDDATSPMILLA